MIGVMSFSKDKHEKFCRCPKCRAETRHTKLDDSELNFGEYLHREIKKETNYIMEIQEILEWYCDHNMYHLKKMCYQC